MGRSKSIEFIVAFHQCGDKSWNFHRGFKIPTSKDEEKKLSLLIKRWDKQERKSTRLVEKGLINKIILLQLKTNLGYVNDSFVVIRQRSVLFFETAN